MKAIVYTSETGHTARYAKLLSERTGLPAYSMQEAERKLGRREPVLYLGWLMAGGTKGYQTAGKLFMLEGVVSVGMTKTPNGTLWNRAVQNDAHVVDGARVFYLQGGYDGSRLHGVYRVMMKAVEAGMAKRLTKKTDRTPEENDMLSMLHDGGDRVREENLTEILDWIHRSR